MPAAVRSRHGTGRPATAAPQADAATRPITCLVAGPGYGKTTLLADWAERTGAAWYILDAHDGDPGLLVAGLLAAVAECVPADGAPPAPLGPQAGSASAVDAMAAGLAETVDRVLATDLALGQPDHYRVHPDRGHPRTRLT
ncbi:hypothetical protein ACFQ0D_09910, partial [Micromonospora zhanjiangensis]